VEGGAVKPAVLTLAVGHRYLNRGGAVLRVVCHDRYEPPKGYVAPNPVPGWFLCVIERMANGDTPELEHKITVREDGAYSPCGPHDLDLIAEVTAETVLPKPKFGWFTPKKTRAA
jgi:hypothetical protein